MKKVIIGIFVIGICLLCVTGCNYQPIEFNYSYDEVVCNYDGDKFELKVDKWTDYEGEQLQVKSNGETYLLSANKCYMKGGE